MAILGLAGYITIYKGIRKGVSRPSFCTWILWTLLNITTLISLVFQHAPYVVAVIYAIGTAIIAGVVFFMGEFSWKPGDTFITIVIATCISILLGGSPYTAVIAGSLASIIAGIPEIVLVIKNPKNASRLAAILFIGANTTATIFTQEKTFINLIFPLSWITYWGIIFLLSLRKQRVDL